VHVLHEILPEGDQEQYPEEPPERRGEEDLEEAGREVEDIECGDREYCAGDDDARACPDRLDDDVLSQRLPGLPAVESPTASMAIGIAASKTCPIFRPEYAAAAEKRTAMKSPQ
jgi:hypothetical protein